ncbi:MAG: hypothetical protein KAR38_11040 [Calditrichia bacterium]|nr:hypothetical protein [Calditrichia bacterium]
MKRYISIVSSLLIFLFINCSNTSSQNNESSDIQLTSSMKGYELFSWPGDEDWQFTLITGTNRSKSFDEICSDEIEVTENGWVKLRGNGVNSIKKILSRLPVGESVLWNDDRFLSGDQGNYPDISFPDNTIIYEIETYCNELGVELSGHYKNN